MTMAVCAAGGAAKVVGSQAGAGQAPALLRGPSIQFVEESIDVGAWMDDRPVEFEFYFKNTGDQPLVVEWPTGRTPDENQWVWAERCPNVRIGPRAEVLWDVVDFGVVGDDAEDLIWEFTCTSVGDEPLTIYPFLVPPDYRRLAEPVKLTAP
jgi:hypothetical protein